MVQAEHLLTVQNEIGESPIWHVAEQALYWADIENAEVHRFDPVSKDHQVIHVDLPVTALCLRESGGWMFLTR